jgi:hypothetical protein
VRSLLYALIVTYLKVKGFREMDSGLWYHRDLGGSRALADIIAWQIGREDTANANVGLFDAPPAGGDIFPPR